MTELLASADDLSDDEVWLKILLGRLPHGWCGLCDGFGFSFTPEHPYEPCPRAGREGHGRPLPGRYWRRD